MDCTSEMASFDLRDRATGRSSPTDAEMLCAEERLGRDPRRSGQVAAAPAEPNQQPRIGRDSSWFRLPAAFVLDRECDLQLASEAKQSAEEVGGHVRSVGAVVACGRVRQEAEAGQRCEHRSETARGSFNDDVVEPIAVRHLPVDPDSRTKAENTGAEFAGLRQDRGRNRRCRERRRRQFVVCPGCIGGFDRGGNDDAGDEEDCGGCGRQRGAQLLSCWSSCHGVLRHTLLVVEETAPILRFACGRRSCNHSASGQGRAAPVGR